MNICIFPGTFNPIHLAHLRMAQFAIQKYGFDKVIFIPAYIPPHKQINSNLAKHRFNMVKLATENNLRFGISDIEYKSEEKSYTINTVKKIIKQFEVEGRLNFIIGTDAFNNIKSWYKADELKDLVHFLVFPRGRDIIDIKEFEEYSFELVDCNKFDISSTELRQFKTYQTTQKVKEYIISNGLYN